MKIKNSKSSSLKQIGDIQGFFGSHLLVIKIFLNMLSSSMRETSETQISPITCTELVRFYLIMSYLFNPFSFLMTTEYIYFIYNHSKNNTFVICHVEE